MDLNQIGKICGHNMEMIMSKDPLEKSAKEVWSVISHDWVSPLAVTKAQHDHAKQLVPTLIDVYKQAKSLGLDIPEIDNRQLDRLQSSMQAENSRIDYLCQYISRLNKKFMYTEFPSEPEDVSIKDCITRAINTFEPIYGFSDDYQLKVDLEDRTINTKPKTITHICYELLSNAEYYLRCAGTGSKLTISGKCDNKKYYLSFKNTGVGIKEEELAKVFEPYYSDRNKIGLGLYYCSAAIKSLNGKIECKSNSENYVEILITLPIK